MIARLEVALNALLNETGAHLSYKRTKNLPNEDPCFNFSIQLTGLNQPQLIHQIVDFFDQEDTNILMLNSYSYILTPAKD